MCAMLYILLQTVLTASRERETFGILHKYFGAGLVSAECKVAAKKAVVCGLGKRGKHRLLNKIFSKIETSFTMF